MTRRQLLKALATTAIGSTFPYLLPSGRLFAQTGTQLAAHVVVVVLGGGVRWQETVGQGYLRRSQYIANSVFANDISGNIMPNLWVGDAPNQKIVYGIDPPDVASGGQYGSLLVTPVVQQALQTQGVLFSAMRTPANDHYTALGTLLTGNIATQTVPNRPNMPTLFEYVRRYMGVSPLQTWYVGSGLDNGTTLLNYSTHADFGAKYGANFIAPDVLFGEKGTAYFGDMHSYDPITQLPYMAEMTQFLNQNFVPPHTLPDIGNTDTERHQIGQFMQQTYQKGNAAINAPFPKGMHNNDTQQIAYTCELLAHFQPTLTVVQLSVADIAHTNFTAYLQSLYRADYGIAYLWQYIQTQISSMASNTCLLVISDFGRNGAANDHIDNNTWRGYDHDDTNNSLQTFALLLCPSIADNIVIGSETNPIGNNQHIALTIAEILGIKEPVAAANNVFSNQSLLDFL